MELMGKMTRKLKQYLPRSVLKQLLRLFLLLKFVHTQPVSAGMSKAQRACHGQLWSCYNAG
eukprot:2384118-Amphidinium_carterae.1